MRRVFDGGEGLINGGIVERSRESGVLEVSDMGLDNGDAGGEVFCVTMIDEIGL